MWDSVVEEVKGDDILESMIVKNVKTGEILAMASYPSYEPKDFLRRDFTREMERI